MTDILNIDYDKTIVVEGMVSIDCNQNNSDPWNYSEFSKKKYFLYTGTLDYRYGIKTLLDAFISSNIKSYKLVICGNGDYQNELLALQNKESNIIYLGMKNRKEILQLQENAFILINPRNNDGEFTRYSFPSKVLEYFVSGVPTLMYKLEGIPEEYYEYCYSIKSIKGINNERQLSNKLRELVSVNSVEIASTGKRAKEYVLKNKNINVQCLKIISTINANNKR